MIGFLGWNSFRKYKNFFSGTIFFILGVRLEKVLGCCIKRIILRVLLEYILEKEEVYKAHSWHAHETFLSVY